MSEEAFEAAYSDFVRRLAFGIRRGRRLSGNTQSDLSEKSGVAQPTISGIESGRLTAGLKVLFRLSYGFGVPVWRLMVLGEATSSSLLLKEVYVPAAGSLELDILANRVKAEGGSEHEAAYRLGYLDAVNELEAWLAGDRA